MTEVAVIVPVLERPQKVAPVLKGFLATAPARVLFIASPKDKTEIEALEAARADFIVLEGGYAEKIRAGIKQTSEPYVFTAADDLEPKAGWFKAAKAAMVDGVELVGINDCLERNTEHSTHFLMTRAYAETPTIDGKPGPFSDEYWHWYCDNELILTGQIRGVYAYAEKAKLLHRHPLWGFNTEDATYNRGKWYRRRDKRIFQKRERRWMSPSA